MLTIGYLITEAETVWLHLGDGRVVQGHALGFDQETGFGLVQALGHSISTRCRSAPRRPPQSATASWSAASAAAPARSPAASPPSRNLPAIGNIVLDEAIFTYPAHPNWGGTGLISDRGELIGIGSLQIEREREGKNEHLNMVVPIDLLKPILDDLRKFGRVNKPPRPWLGVFSAEIDNKVVVVGISAKGPAARAELKSGD